MDAIIIGGGLNGSTLALALAGAGFEVTLIDRLSREVQASHDFDGRCYALAHGSVRLLRALGLWDALEDDAEPILKVRVSDGRAGEGASPLALLFDGAEIEEHPVGHMIEDRHLRRALLRALAAVPGVTHLTRREVTDHRPEPAGVAVELDDGQVLRAQVAVGADGADTATGRRAGIGRMGWSYGQVSLTCAIAHERPHHGVAHQFFMPSGPLAVLPLPKNRAAIVWTEDERAAARIAAMDDAAYLEMLRPRVGTYLGDIQLAGQRSSFPVPLSLAHRFHGDRVALIGDAAHRVHPLAGQGLNAGLKDVAALAEVLADARRRGEDFGRTEVLARYTRWRRFDVASLALATDGVNRLFSNDIPGLRLLRDLGLGAIDAMPGLRRTLMREAAGVTGELPRLMRGLPV